MAAPRPATATGPAIATGPATATLPRVLNRTRGTVLAECTEMADTFGRRFVGLMGRSTLADGDGLWLTGTGSIHMLFMRFAIDAVFLGPAAADGARRVVGLNAGLRPWTGIAVARGAGGVLELPAGTVAATGTALGDEVVLEATPERPG